MSVASRNLLLLHTPSAQSSVRAVTDVQSSDPDGSTENGGGLTYTLTGGADLSKFAINANTGVLTFITAPNYESPTDVGANNTYGVQVTVTDPTGRKDAQGITVSVVSVSEPPVIVSDGGGATASVTVNEGTAFVTDVQSFDQDGTLEGPNSTTNFTYSITGGKDRKVFQIDAHTGVLSFKTASDYEAPTDRGANNVYDVEVTVKDPGGLPDKQAIAVTLQDINDPPEFLMPGETDPSVRTDDYFTYEINDDFRGTVGILKAGDPDQDSYSFAPGSFPGPFYLNGGAPGRITVMTGSQLPLSEYTFTVIVTDSNDGTDTAVVTINVNHAPSFSEDRYFKSIRKDHRGTILQADATDPEEFIPLRYQPLTYTSSGSHPFDVNSTNCIISCSADVPSGSYTFTMTVSDGTLQDTAEVMIVVENSPEGVLYVEGLNDGHPVHYNDVDQQGNGDCWLMAAMAQLAYTRPESIVQMIQPNDNGTYAVHHFDSDGNPVDTTVGPFYNHGNAQAGYGDVDPVTQQRELWPIVLEAAIMMHMGGNPSVICGDTSSLGQTVLTGPGAVWNPLPGYTLAELKADLNAGNLVTMSTTSAASSSGTGLVGPHAYAVLSVIGSTVTLFNPHGNERTYDWSVLTPANGVAGFTVHP